MRRLAVLCLIFIGMIGAVPTVQAEDGYELWLRYQPLDQPDRAKLSHQAEHIALLADDNGTTQAAIVELQRALTAMTGAMPDRATGANERSILLARRERLPAALARNTTWLRDRRPGAYMVVASVTAAQPSVLIAANDDIGLVYGAFAWLRTLQTKGPSAPIHLAAEPQLDLRLLDHWDNPDGFVERGYAGRSIFDWWHLPGHVDRRIIDYARANASIGINGVVVNNVNAKAEMLTAAFIAKASALAATLRPYGIRLYLSARFSAPRELGDLPTADPLDPRVAAWWKRKADELYEAIPDFGGFLVKANSEGQPGPQDYGRTHADGANMLARAIGSRGVVMWRAFVYQSSTSQDRAKQAYDEFKPLDGRFDPNVILQVKNGPIDFQPREPFHPLFGAMPKTPLMLEVQITKEYLGFATHLAYLAPLYEEVLDADTFARGPGSTVAHVIDGTLEKHRLSGMAGVANIGSDRNWTGSHFDQANWFAFGRLAWDPGLSSADIARDWAAMTFTPDPSFLDGVVPLMMRSRQAVVDYMTPLGLAHLMGTGHHYGPAPWVNDLQRPEWNPTYYHRADRHGIGFDRTASGSNAIAQYAPDAARRFADPDLQGGAYMLWFHHLPWTRPMPGGGTLWSALVGHYDHGVATVADMGSEWRRLAPLIDPERARDISDFLVIQHAEARWWRDASLAYFMQVSGLPLPAGIRPPDHDLAYYEAMIFPYAPGN